MKTKNLVSLIALIGTLASSFVWAQDAAAPRDVKAIGNELKEARKAYSAARSELSKFASKNKLTKDEALQAFTKSYRDKGQEISTYRSEFAAAQEGGPALQAKLKTLRDELNAIDKTDKEARKAKGKEITAVQRELSGLLNKNGIRNDEKLKALDAERREASAAIQTRLFEVVAAHPEGKAIADAYTAAAEKQQSLADELTDVKKAEVEAKKAAAEAKKAAAAEKKKAAAAAKKAAADKKAAAGKKIKEGSHKKAKKPAAE